MTGTEEEKVLTLEEALAAPRKHRDMKLAAEPMPNFSSTGEYFLRTYITYEYHRCMGKEVYGVILSSIPQY